MSVAAAIRSVLQSISESLEPWRIAVVWYTAGAVAGGTAGGFRIDLSLAKHYTILAALQCVCKPQMLLIADNFADNRSGD